MAPCIAAAVAGVGGAIAALALLGTEPAKDGAATSSSPRPVWTEVQWPFPVDPWGKGKAFRCKAADCGNEVHVYLRAKLGFCNCTTGIADDADLDRMGDLYLIGGEVSPLGTGRPITVGSMQGRSRAYALTARDGQGKAVISFAFNQRCDMVAATVVLQHDRPATIEPTLVDFLNSRTVLSWAEVSLGL
jgi:hypothetical protein